MALTPEQLNTLKSQLEKTLSDIEVELQEYESTTGEEKPKEMGSDVEGEDWAEEADEAEELATNIGITQGLKDRKENILHALDKIKKDIYGKCEKCGMDIGYDLLSVDPESRFDQHCKEAAK